MTATTPWQTKPYAITVKKDETIAFCACGLSKNGPYCDGSHVATDLTPHVVTFDADKTIYACGCKHSNNRPYCDGTHKTLKSESTNTTAPIANSTNNNAIESFVPFIHELAKHGLDNVGHDGPIDAMGVPRSKLPNWDDIQLLTAQLATTPLLQDQPVATKTIIGPNAKKPVEIAFPIIVSDMSFGALSEEAKIAMSKGAELAGTAICSGEGGMLEEERKENSHYFYELASAKFGYSIDKVKRCQAFHFKGGQAAKTGTGGHLPGIKVTDKIAKTRGLNPGDDAISPARFENLTTVEDFKAVAKEVRDATGGIPIGFKLSAQHIEQDIDTALEIGVDYIILDGRGGGTGAAPLLFRDHISVPTIPALARARKHLDNRQRNDITLIITGGLRTPADFVKALALGADVIAIANAAMQAIGCLGTRACHKNTCPVGIATQREDLRKLINVDEAAKGLERFLLSSVHLMSQLARACGHNKLADFSSHDLTTWKHEMHLLSGVAFGGVKEG